MLHIHFGCGKLGLGLAAPFFKTEKSELFLLNRSAPHPIADHTNSPEMSFSSQRNALLSDDNDGSYLISHYASQDTSHDAHPARATRVNYDGFFAYDDNIESIIKAIIERSHQCATGVIVTAALTFIEHYDKVVRALRVLSDASATPGHGLGKIYFVACENMFSAADALAYDAHLPLLTDHARNNIECIGALVDRICSSLDICLDQGRERLRVCTEPYGKLTLALRDENRELTEMLSTSKVNFSKHLNAEREIKGWLLNGSHWLIALTAFRETNGNPQVKLNTFITESTMHRYYAGEIITEMRQGVEALLRADPTYAAFLHDIDITAYLDHSAASILLRFASNEDSIVRILRRFRAPSPEDVGAVQTFVDSLLQKIERPLHAYAAQYGAAPRASTEALMNVLRLQATATYPSHSDCRHVL